MNANRLRIEFLRFICYIFELMTFDSQSDLISKIAQRSLRDEKSVFIP